MIGGSLFSIKSFVLKSDGRILFACFTIGFLVRLIPELLAYPHPIGFDTIDYAVIMNKGAIWSDWSSFFTSTWLLYSLIVPAYWVLGGDPFVVLKTVAPLLFGLNTAGIFWFARRGLNWTALSSLAACGFFAVQLASLRIGWDLLRNTLGMALLLFTLPLIKKLDSKRGFACFAALGLLTVFAHEYAAVTFLAVVVGLLVWNFAKSNEDVRVMRLAVGIAPALAVFFVGLFLRLSPVVKAHVSNVIEAENVASRGAGGFFFLTDYLRVQSAVDNYATYWNLAGSVIILFAALYSLYLFLVLKGFFRNQVLTLWTGLLLLGAFGCLIFPFSALEYWHRWMFMLVYPFTFYAITGLRRLRLERRFTLHAKGFRVSHFGGKLMVLGTVALGGCYLATPLLMTYSNVNLTYLVGSAAYFSTSPTVPYEDVGNVVDVMRWLNTSMEVNSCVLLQHAFLGWGRLYLSDSHVIVHFETDTNKAVAAGLGHGYTSVYFVWWNVKIGWYGVEVPQGFGRIHDCGRLSVYEYLG